MNQPIIWTPGVTLEAIEKQVIKAAYAFYKGNAAQTAIALGVSDKTIRNKLEEYEKDDKRRQTAQDAERAERVRQINRSRGLADDTPYGSGTMLSAYAGIRDEPTSQVPAQQPVPVPESEEIQSVLPVKASHGRESRRR
jgi:hypothetical protein